MRSPLYTLSNPILCALLLAASHTANAKAGEAYSFIADEICVVPQQTDTPPSIEQAERLYREKQFQRKAPQFVSTLDASIWIRLELSNNDSFAKPFVIKSLALFADEARLFFRTPEGEVRKLISGQNTRLENKDLHSEEQVFLLSVPSRETQVYFLHLTSVIKVFTGVEAYPLSQYYARNRRQDRITGIYFGMFGVLLLSAGLAYRGNPRKDLKLYFLFLVSVLLAIYIYQNLHLSLFPWLHSPWHSYVVIFLASLASILQIRFTWHFLGLENTRIWLRRSCLFLLLLATTACIAAAVVGVAVLVLQNSAAYTAGDFVIKFAAAILLFNSICMPFVGIVSLRCGNKDARLYIAAFVCLFAGAIPIFLSNINLKERSENDILAIQLGSALHLIFFALALAGKIFSLRNERNAAKREAQLETDRRLEIEQLAAEILKQKILLEDQSDRIQKTNKELEKTNAELNELSQQKRKFLGIAVHDLKSPLTGIISAIYLLSQNEKEPEASILDPKKRLRFLGQIDRAAHAMSKTLDSLLLADANDQIEKELHSQQIDLSEILNACIAANRAHAQSKKIKILASINGPLPYKADPKAMEEIFNNLLSNAIKFNPKGEPVSISAHRIESEAQIKFQDSGPGFTDEDLTHLFEPHQKLSARPTNNESSSGLGLSIAKHYIDACGGTIDLERGPLFGTTFTLTFPLEEKDRLS